MRERRYEVRSRGRSSSPRRQHFNLSRHRRYSPHHRSPHHRRGREEFSREAETSRRTERRDQFDRDFNLRGPRFSEYDSRSRDRDSYVVGGRQSRSPWKIEKMDRDVNTGTVRLYDFEDGGRGAYKEEVCVGRSRRSYDEDSYHADLSSTKYQWNHHLDGPRRSDHLDVKDYSITRDCNGDGYTNITTGGGKRDYYTDSHYVDLGQPSLLSASQYSEIAKPVSHEYERGRSMHSHSYTLAHGGVDSTHISNLSGNDGISHTSSVASRYLYTDTDKEGYFHFRNELHLEKRDQGLRDQEDCYFEKKSDGSRFQGGFLGVQETVGRAIYKFEKEDNLLSSQGYLKGDSDCMVSSSQRKDYGAISSGILREGFLSYSASGDLHMPTTLIQPESGLASQPIGFDQYSERKQGMFPRGLEDQLDDTRSRSRLYIGLPEEKQENQLYAEFGRSKIDSTSTRLNDVEKEYRDQHMSRIDVLNPAVDESSHKKHMRDDGLWDQYPFSQVQSMPDKFDAGRSLHPRKQDLDIVGGSSHLNYGTKGYSGFGSLKSEEHHAEADGGLWSHVERSDILQPRGYDPSFGRLFDGSRKRPALADLSLVESSERMLRQEHDRDEILYEHDVGIRIFTDGDGARKVYNEVDVGDEIDLVNLSETRRSGKSNYNKTWKASFEMANDQPRSSKFNPSRVKLRKSDSRDIKRRLGPVPRKLHVSQRLVKKYKPSVKKRLAPPPPKNHATLPWLKNLSSNRMESTQDDSDGNPHDHDGDHLGDHLPLAKPEPPEKSGDFKQLVQSAFLKLLKQINETPAKRKKYMEQGKAGTLKCIVCGSNSDEFVETESLAIHTFTSDKVGLRSQHLGLHRALCVLMGWKIAEEPSGEWHSEAMSNAETSALKEDLIIWPPVVIVHNRTIDNKNPDERVIVSTENLDMKLRGMGFQSILKVCNGKPANQSVLLVKFNGTLSGLQEADRLHTSYVESKHGRVDLEHLKSVSRGTQVISAEREGKILYGHLGIAEDLEKLDFDTKKRCVLRSKKEILSIVDAPLDTEGENGC